MKILLGSPVDLPLIDNERYQIKLTSLLYLLTGNINITSFHLHQHQHKWFIERLLGNTVLLGILIQTRSIFDMDNKKVEVVFEEEKDLKLRDRENEETKKKRDSLSRAGPRRTAEDDDSCSVSSSSSEDSSSSSPSSRCSSPITLPIGCLRESDGCDESELLARKKRCLEIMRLSRQVKKKAERAQANKDWNTPLTWADPTFKLGKRKWQSFPDKDCA